MSNNKTSCVIAAAGKGSRSGLDYPKCLFEIDGKAILIRILESMSCIDNEPVIIVSPDGKKQILQKLSLHNFSAKLLIQEQALGMGNAVTQLKKISDDLKDNILLSWGDIPFLSTKTLLQFQEHYYDTNSDFSLITAHTTNPYTIVERDKNNQIVKVIETRNIPNYKKKPSNKIEERDIGVFLFKKRIILEYLEKSLDKKFGAINDEHGFLYIIEHLVKDGYKVSTTSSINDLESVSFNSQKDLKGFI